MFGDDFDLVIGQSDDIRRKPAPDGLLKAAEEFGVLPGECMYIGDTKTDMLAGKAAKMLTIGVLWGFRDLEELTGNGADLVVKKPEELLEIYDRYEGPGKEPGQMN